MPFVMGFLKRVKRRPGRPDIGLPAPPVDPEHPEIEPPDEGDDDLGIWGPGGGMPSHPIRPTLPPRDQWPPLPPGLELPPPIVALPIPPTPEFPMVPVDPPPEPGVPPPTTKPLPPGMVWPPIIPEFPSLGNKVLALVLVATSSGVKWRWAVLDLSLVPRPK